MRPTTATFRLLAVAASAAALHACGNGTPEPQERASTPVPVATAAARVLPMAERLEAGGIVSAGQTAEVASRILAPILEVRVRAGDIVRRGEVLVTLDARDVADYARQAQAGVSAAEQALAQARAERAAAQAEETMARAWHTRISGLHARNSATAQERDEADARLASATARRSSTDAAISAAQANVEAARAGAGAASTTQSFTVIRAPFDALVTERLNDPGNMATPGTPLLRLESTDVRRVEATVDEARAAFVNVGDTIEIVIDSGQTARPPLTGRVTEIARAIAADRRAFTIKATLPPGDQPRTGSFARIRFEGRSRQMLAVPAAAVRRHGQVTSVFVVGDGVARLRLVQVGRTSDDRIEILAGLDAGELVVVTPPPQLTDSQAVVSQPIAASGDPQ